MRLILKISVLFIIFLSVKMHGADLITKSSFTRDAYNLYYNYYSVSINDVKNQIGTISGELFFDQFGLKSTLNGINTFNNSLSGARFYLNNNWKNLYYTLGLGSDNLRDTKNNMFYDLALAYLFPLGRHVHLVLNVRLKQSRFQQNPFAVYLEIPNQITLYSAQLKMSKFFMEAAYQINSLKKSRVPADMFINPGLITKVPANELQSFYVYFYSPVLHTLNVGLVYSSADSKVNMFQPTLKSFTQNLYTYFPYFTPINSQALSILFFGEQKLRIGSVDLGTLSFKAQVPLVSSASLLYEVKQGPITVNDSVYYDYSGVEPLKIELSWRKKIPGIDAHFTIGYDYFDKPYIKNKYFGDALTGYQSHQISFTINKSL